MCKRKDPTDPLVKRCLETYNVNLLPLPRQRAVPGELYIQTGRKVKATSGSISRVIEPDVVLPEPYTEALPDMTGVASEAVDRKVGLGLLGNFLAAIGVPPGIVDDVKVGYQHSSTARVAFEFDDVTRESIDPFAIGSALVDHRFKHHPWVREGNRYLVAAGFVRSPSITIQAQDETLRAVDLGAGLVKVLEASAAVSAEQSGEGKIVVRGEQPLAIAVELYELRWDDEMQSFQMGGQREPVALVRGREVAPEPAFPAEDDEALLVVEDLEDEVAAVS